MFSTFAILSDNNGTYTNTICIIDPVIP